MKDCRKPSSAALPRSSVWLRYAALPVLVLLSMGFYLNAIDHDFVWDDRVLILENAYIQDARLLGEGLLSDFWQTYEDPRRFRHYYRPTVIMTYFLDYSTWGENPAGYHATNIILHTANVLLLFLVTARLFRSLETAFLTSALFAVHPIHTESVSWISGRTDLLASLFVLSSYLCYLKIRNGRSIKLLVLLSNLIYILAVLSKEVAIVLPGALALTVVLLVPRGDTSRPKLQRAALIQFMVGCFYVLFRIIVLQMPLFVESQRPIWLLLWNLPRILSRYVLKLIVPVQMYAHDPMAWVRLDGWLEVISALALISLAIMTVAWLGRKNPRALLGGGWILLFLLPVLNAGTFTDVLIAERFLYLPSIGLCWILGAAYELAKERSSSRKLAWTIAAAVILTAGLRTWFRNPVWRDQITLFETMVRSSPHYTLPHLLLGAAYQSEGDAAEALKHYRRALQLEPDDCRALNAMALTQLELGVYQRSGSILDNGFEFTQRAVEQCPEEDFLRHTLAEYYLRQKNTDQAVAEFRKAIEMNPERTGYYYNIGAVLYASGRREEARPYLERYVEKSAAGDELRSQALEWLKK